MAETLVVPTKPTSQDETRTKRQPPYAVVVLNDEFHTFNYVIETFQKVLGYELEKCVLLAKKIHVEGRTIVWTGSREVAELKKEQIEGMGPDHYAHKTVTWPLGVELEPMA